MDNQTKNSLTVSAHNLVDIRNRMCKKYGVKANCVGCPLAKYNNRCHNIWYELDKMLEDMLIWETANPLIRYIDVFIEKFPNAKIDSYGKPHNICPVNLGMRSKCAMEIHPSQLHDPGFNKEEMCARCWLKEYEEPKV